MKKMIAALLAVLLMLSLCACGAEEAPAEDMDITVLPKVEGDVVPQETAADMPENPAEETTAENAATVANLKALAESCIDKDVSELYALIGEPISADYAPSCLVQGGEDGMLYYDGFVVYTTREGDVETVYYVE